MADFSACHRPLSCCCSLLLAGESALSQNKLAPLARVVAMHEVGCDPAIMGIGPADAIRGALQKAGLTLADMDLVEVRTLDGSRETTSRALRKADPIPRSPGQRRLRRC